MPFFDWVNKAQAQHSTANAPFHQLEFQLAGGSGQSMTLIASIHG